MTTLFTALGFVLVFEGLVFALAPSRLEELMRALENIPVETRRLLGLGGVATGVAVLWIVRAFGG